MSFIRISFKNELAYRMSLIFGVFWTVFSVGVAMALWRYLYSDDPAMQSYMTQYMVLSGAIGGFYNFAVGHVIGTKVLDGSIVTDLIRPSNLLKQVWLTEFGEMLSRLAFNTLPAVLIFLPAFIGEPALNNIIPALAAVALGHLLQGFLQAFIGYSAFVLVEARPFLQITRAVSQLFSGALIPLALFPGALGSVAYVLPFRLLYSFPLTLMLGEPVEWGSSRFYEALGNYALMVGWIALFYVCTRIMRHFAMRKFVVHGG